MPVQLPARWLDVDPAAGCLTMCWSGCWLLDQMAVSRFGKHGFRFGKHGCRFGKHGLRFGKHGFGAGKHGF